jgi:phosphoribosyl 1,2-cyclic phosphodiesterase
MQLHVIGSSSKGNCYILESSSEALILEAGCKLMEVKKALHWQLSKVVGCAVSHEHNDHAGYAAEYAAAGIKVLALPAVQQAKCIKRNAIAVELGKAYKMGSFVLQPFEVMHDVPCVGYMVKQQELGKLVFFTDTFACKYRFKGVSTYMVEANYCDELLEANIEAGKVPMLLRNRLMTSHMELHNTIGFLRSSDLSSVRNIVLVHLSAGNAEAARFEEAVMAATGLPAVAAREGLTMEVGTL